VIAFAVVAGSLLWWAAWLVYTGMAWRVPEAKLLDEREPTEWDDSSEITFINCTFSRAREWWWDEGWGDYL
jgi:hypothetical protein